MTSLSELLARARVVPRAREGNATVVGASSDTRTCKPGQLFVCMPSERTDTHGLLPEAARLGAAAVVVHREEGVEAARAVGLPVVWLEGPGEDFDRSVSAIAREAFGDPTASMRVFGVTGTNGKTTTAWVLADALAKLGRRSAYLGTLGFRTMTEFRELANTTPFAVDLMGLLAEARDQGATDVAMEVSSHALAGHRVDGVRFDVGGFTNLTQDHLDFHVTMAAYERAKERLFSELAEASGKPFAMAINAEDPAGRRLISAHPWPTVSFGTAESPLQVEVVALDALGCTLRWSFGGDSATASTNLGGRFNVQNLCTACAMLLAAGHSLEEAASALDGATAAPGRFESVGQSGGVAAIVDYAHTPDALEKVLLAAREFTAGALWVVFGCGGDRDRTKRPLMGAVAASMADRVVLTSDNPRSEDPMAILKDIEAGMGEAGRWSIPDREAAVDFAIRTALPGDLVVVAGKGHETYQIVGDTKLPLDDRQLAREALAHR